MRPLSCLLLLCFSLGACALPSDHARLMQITANSSIFNYKTGTQIYEGNVKVDQGTTHLTADRMITSINHHKIEKAVAFGINQLAEYSTLPKPGDTLFVAKAKKIALDLTTSTITLEGNVNVTQGKNNFHGSLIIYNMKDQTVTAPASKTGRATIVIEPDKLNL